MLQYVAVCCSRESLPQLVDRRGRVCCSVSQYITVYYSVLQYIAVCCSMLQSRESSATRPLPWQCILQCVAVCCSVLHCGAVCYILRVFRGSSFAVAECVAVCCSILQCVAVCCTMLQSRESSATRRLPWQSVLQCVAVYCSVLQCVAVCHSRSVFYDSSFAVAECVAVCCSVLQCQHTVSVCCS